MDIELLNRLDLIHHADRELLQQLKPGETIRNSPNMHRRISYATLGLYGLEFDLMLRNDPSFELLEAVMRKGETDVKKIYAVKSAIHAILNHEQLHIKYEKTLICQHNWADLNREDDFNDDYINYFDQVDEFMLFDSIEFNQLDLTEFQGYIKQQKGFVVFKFEIELAFINRKMKLVKNLLTVLEPENGLLKERTKRDIVYLQFPYLLKKLVLLSAHWYQPVLRDADPYQHSREHTEALKVDYQTYLLRYLNKRWVTRHLLQTNPRLAVPLVKKSQGQPSDFKRLYHFMVRAHKQGCHFNQFIELYIAYYEDKFGQPLSPESYASIYKYVARLGNEIHTTAQTEAALINYIILRFNQNHLTYR